MRKLFFNLISASLILMILLGCEKDPNSAISEEELELSAIEEIVMDENNEYLIDWGVDDLDETNMYDGFSTFGLGKLMIPLNNVFRFGRKIERRVPRTLIIRRISRDSVLVISERVLLGQFVVFDKISNTNTNTDTFGITRKPLKHSVKRKAIFVRKNLPSLSAIDDPRQRFKLAAISLSEGESRPYSTVQIEQIDIESTNGYEASFINPMETILSVPEELPTFIINDIVTITALISNSTTNPVEIDPGTGSTETLLLHFGVNQNQRARKRFKFIGIDPVSGFNKYQGTWKVREPVRRPYHCVIDAIDNGTIYDDDNETYPYNASTWGCPYRVVWSQDSEQ
jgi:hypothetical protein